MTYEQRLEVNKLFDAMEQLNETELIQMISHYNHIALENSDDARKNMMLFRDYMVMLLCKKTGKRIIMNVKEWAEAEDYVNVWAQGSKHGHLS